MKNILALHGFLLKSPLENIFKNSEKMAVVMEA